MKTPKFTDAHRFSRPYVPASEQGDNYLQRRFYDIAEQQRRDAEERLKKCISMKVRKS